MFEYTHRNYLRFGYNGGTFNPRETPGDLLWIDFAPMTETPGSFADECVRAAKLIREKSSEPIWVCYSGGVDSEVVLLAFRRARIPVRAATVRFKNDLNFHDIRFAIEFCKSQGIPHDLFDLDIRDFWAGPVWDYCRSTFCPSPQFPVVMWLMEQIPGIPVAGSGDMALIRRDSTNEFYFKEEEKYLALYQFLIQSKRPGVPAFLQYTPELMYSFLNHPMLHVYRRYKARAEGLLSIYKYKTAIYSSSFPEIKDRDVCSGFEQVREADLELRSRLNQYFSAGGHKIIFDLPQFEETLRGHRANEYQLQLDQLNLNEASN